ncbi:zinc phosphodiesterase ELAC protein 1-like [Bolinopsis microptera]|uniref:zinc phosphodiesterase ELAC protein 1-like n=1 Tax=Bolinopsis microptera TaxID=2820187 RepID=UPI003079C89E
MVATIDLVFLGTGSCYPSPSRGASSTILRLDGECWMFDCGEGTQIQYQRSNVKPGKLTRIFITHLHGDHLFGLPGLMCLIQGTVTGSATAPEPLHLYGPVGLARYIRTSLILSGTEFTRPYTVHEIDIENTGYDPTEDTNIKHVNETPGRVINLRNNAFSLFETPKYKVEAGILSHRLPCVGFVITEAPSVGSLNTVLLKELGVPPGPMYGKLKSGHSITGPSGHLITPNMVLGQNKRGRKIVILGDTCDNSKIEHIARDPDVVVHEATHQDELVDKAIECGHSTPSMAADFCKKIRAQSLVLTHFSQRYKDNPEDCKSDDDVCTSYLAEQARRDGMEVVAAHDFSPSTLSDSSSF